MAQPGDAPRPAVGGTDWTVQAADTIERVVGAIRDKTSLPLTTVARALVYGLLAAVMGLTIVVFSAVASVRVITAYLVGGEVWAAYLVVGGIFALPGVFLLRKASSTKTPTRTSKGNGRT